MKIKKYIDDIRAEFKRKPLVTGVMFFSLLVGILSFIKPGYTSSLAGYFGLTILNLGILSSAIFLVYWFYVRRRLR